ncbi:MAG: phosphoribosyltransferase [Bacteroidetes bacterium]|nr:phosphoribosyltransferase [Bacteroidota bacterium]
MESGQIHRAIRRIAIQIVEDLQKENEVLLVGINKRGFFIAEQLQKALHTSGLPHTLALNLDVHHDKLTGEKEFTTLAETRHIILVDDVLFSGSTMLKAFRFVLDVVQPKTMKIAVLVDRGHRKYPIQPDYVGITSPTKLREHVSVSFDGNGIPDSVRLVQTGS